MLFCFRKTYRNLKKMLVLLLFYYAIVLSACNPLTGDNKVTNIDSAPKPQLTALTIRTDIPPVFTNSFTGIIHLVEKNLFDTIFYRFYIHKNFVKIDKFRNGSNFESLIIDLKNKNINVLNHLKQLYSSINVEEEKTVFDSTFKIIKTNNEKNILGRKCKQWRVKNVKENTEVTYWVDSSNYGFYYYLIKLWNPTTKPNKYFQIIANSFGSMPLEVVERSILRDIKSSLNVTKIDITDLDTNIFSIPKNYVLFSN